ncbi:hypothetical protein [uncultured Tateyamaria sp.]|nr:hypothetical protein [uncultured Tateyamaria sp.]
MLLLPSTNYRSDLQEIPVNRFRLGFGLSGLNEGLAALETHILRNKGG